MKETNLRPIGTEFWIAYPVSSAVSLGRTQERFLYRIVAHDECAYSLDPDSLTYKTERIVAIASQGRPVIGMRSVELSDRTIMDYVFGEWEEISWKESETPHHVEP